MHGGHPKLPRSHCIDLHFELDGFLHINVISYPLAAEPVKMAIHMRGMLQETGKAVETAAINSERRFDTCKTTPSPEIHSEAPSPRKTRKDAFRAVADWVSPPRIITHSTVQLPSRQSHRWAVSAPHRGHR